MNSEDLVRKADDVIFEIFHDFNLFDFVTPLNGEAEREKFLDAWGARKQYQPQFEYRPPPRDLRESKERLRALTFGIETLDLCYERARQEFLRTLEVVEAVGTEKVTASSIGIYGAPAPDLIKEARQMVREGQRAPKEPREVGVRGLAERFREQLREDRIDGWDIVEDPNGVMLASTDPAHRKIRLQSGIIVSPAMVNRLLQHEIGTHVYRSVNGQRQPYKAFAIGLDGHLATEEGLAVELEERLKLATPNVRRRYAGRVLAASLAPTANFFDMFRGLVEFFPPEEAFNLVQRSKRGVHDTSQPGGFVQDHIYLAGRKEVKGLSDTDYQLLYTGRVAVHHLPLIRELMAQKKILAAAFFPSVFHG
ncbi:MAG: tyrosine/phenylalanine carboxypeptidase domain-containing protein [Pseudomonadota bacterium]